MTPDIRVIGQCEKCGRGFYIGHNCEASTPSADLSLMAKEMANAFEEARTMKNMQEALEASPKVSEASKREAGWYSSLEVASLQAELESAKEREAKHLRELEKLRALREACDDYMLERIAGVLAVDGYQEYPEQLRRIAALARAANEQEG